MKSDLQFKEDSKLIHKYLNEIRKGLNTHTKATNKYLHGLKNALYDYAESSGDRCITMEEIIEKFGEPRECADQYNTEYGTKFISENGRKKYMNNCIEKLIKKRMNKMLIRSWLTV